MLKSNFKRSFFKGDKKSKICAITDEKCYDEAKEFMIYNEAATEVNTNVKKCNCLPNCDHIKYEVEVSRTYRGVSLAENAVSMSNVLF